MSSSPPPIFVINMDKSLDRLSRMSTQIPKLGQNFIRVTGVVGSELSPQEIKENSTYLCRTFCTYSQIGCFLSHKKVWQMIADGPDEMAIVLEDDCEVIDNFNKDYLDTIKAVSQVDPNWDFVYLGCFGGCSVDRSSYGIMSRLSVLASKNLTQPDGFLSDLLYVPQSPVGFHCYTLTRSCARKLLKKMNITLM
jgi:GR25 family glycosyltransferase involved in LPS biosynthesis